MQDNESILKKDHLITGIRARLYHPLSRWWIDFVLRSALCHISLKPNERFLDIGCGTGAMLKRIYDVYGSSVSLFGIDGSSDMIAEARKLLTGCSSIQVQTAFAQELPFENNFFDTVGSTLAFHHISPEGKRNALHEVQRVLKQGGLFVISDLGRPGSWFGRILAWFSNAHSYTAGNMEEIETTLRALGFVIRSDTRTFGWIETIVAIRA